MSPGELRILAVSDIHGRIRFIRELKETVKNEKPHILTIAGDVTDFGTVQDAISILETIHNVNPKLKLLFVPGNCDSIELLNYRGKGESIVNLHCRSIMIHKYNIIGFGGSPVTPFNTEIEFEDEEIFYSLKELFESVSGEIILLSHAPPYGTKADIVHSGSHVGSRSIRKIIEEYSPILVICGHIHESRCIDKVGRTLIVNPGPFYKGYYAKIIIRNYKVEDVELKSFRK